MARARNIKPAFFTNEQLADNCPLGRLLFIGLWTLADYKGDLEWKERTIKIQILPWDNCDLKDIAINLDKSGLVRFYSDGDKVYLNIPNFEKHQNPHLNEKKKGSDIPCYSDSKRQVVDLTTLAINPDKSRSVPNDSQSDPAESLILNPESPILNPDIPNPEPTPQPAVGSDKAAPLPQTPPKLVKPKSTAKGADTWNAYTEAYFQRYGIDPVRNAKVSGQVSQVVDRLGAEDAPHVAAFFVHHNNGYYVANGHAIGALLRDAEKIRTEWATGRKVTQTMARQADRTASNPFAKMLTNQEH